MGRDVRCLIRILIILTSASAWYGKDEKGVLQPCVLKDLALSKRPCFVVIVVVVFSTGRKDQYENFKTEDFVSGSFFDFITNVRKQLSEKRFFSVGLTHTAVSLQF